LALCPLATFSFFSARAVPTPASTGGQALAPELPRHFLDPMKASANKVVILIFVRTDCPISNRYAPTVQRLSTAYAGKAAFWLVYPARAESADMIRKHEHDFG